MTTALQRRRGTTTEHDSFTGLEGEITVDTSKDTAVVHDGVTPGGHELAKADGSNISFGDNVKAKFGASDDLQIYHDGAKSKILDTGTGDLRIEANNLSLRATNGDTYAYFTANGAADLYHNNSKKLATTSTGVDVTGNVSLPDNGKAKFGAGDDLQIYHDGANSYIKDSGTGDLKLQGNNLTIGNTADTKYFTAVNGGKTAIYHQGNERLATTSTGVDVTGTVTADGLDILVDSDDRVTIGVLSGDALINAVTSNYASYQPLLINGSELRLLTGALERARIDSSGNVGIGTSSPAQNLHISASTDTRIALENTSNRRYDLISGDSGEFRIWDTAVGERMRIDSSGNLLVGKTSSGTGTVGAEMKGDGYLIATRSGNRVASFNRTTSDGEILRFAKDDSTVGSIGTKDSDLFIGSGSVNLRFDNTFGHIVPVLGDGTYRDNVVDIGSSSARINDVFLGGGVHLGGTGAANKLDDYETGTYTATLTPATSGSFTLTSVINTLQYVKVGDLVTVSGYIEVASASSPSGSYIKLSLPFASANLSQASNNGSAAISYNLGSGWLTAASGILEGTAELAIELNAASIGSSDDFRFCITYRAV